MITNNPKQPTCILAHYISYRRDCTLYNELVTYVSAFFPDEGNIIPYIVTDAIISVKLRNTGRQGYRKKGVYDYVYDRVRMNRNKTVKKVYKLTPYKVPILQSILQQEQFSPNVRLTKQELAIFEDWYVNGSPKDRIADKNQIEIREVKRVCTKAINYFADVYKLSKVIALEPTKKQPTKKELVLLEY